MRIRLEPDRIIGNHDYEFSQWLATFDDDQGTPHTDASGATETLALASLAEKLGRQLLDAEK